MKMEKEFYEIHKKTFADALNFLGFRYYKFTNFLGQQVYTFKNTEKLQKAMSNLLELKKEISSY
ncbi:hypothetical protein KM792_14835 [Clostridium tyrobutyricum]|uniref:hypothetical protein n=1 Tax=Clostridium tyrobutyricum TaxID=1519 RepID=UPI001C3865A1|nr:hypothetical protein [Clostridium tyrobutyricum]MBV4427616.1 hypothetical protein [Clostridium tyrobutyricum]MBV4442647.1 hypothetical protein [Clostridium tyrobutyricum]MBV4450910.1 hypothetical protein [Clostridium tyrobutyricum]